MELLLGLLPFEVAYATVQSNFFNTLTSGANMFVNIIKWAALLWVLVKVAMMGFKISTQSKSSAEAITVVKNEGVALAIGLFIVMTAFMIHGAMKSTMNSIGTSGKTGTGETITNSGSDVFTTKP